MTSQDEAVKLSPCPFCGFAAEVRYVTGMTNEFRASCTNKQCYARISFRCADGHGPGRSSQDTSAETRAVEAWNRRALVPRPPAGEAVPWEKVRDAFEIGLKSYTTVILPNEIARPLFGYLFLSPPSPIPTKASAEDSGVMRERLATMEQRCRRLAYPEHPPVFVEIADLLREVLNSLPSTEREPSGYKLVPVEPTEAMLEAGEQFNAVAVRLRGEGRSAVFGVSPDLWRAMLAAAPVAPTQPEKEREP